MEDAQIFAAVSLIIVALTGSLALIGVLTFAAVQRLRRKAFPAAALPSDERLEQLQQSVDAIAIEVERIAEAQRFTAKLLADRSEGVALKR